jgi:secreted trypsin-like serine protease
MEGYTMLNHALLISFFLTQSPIAQGFFDSNLINGRAVKKGEYPEVVQVYSGRSFCSAALVGERAMLTAGHCVEDGQWLRIYTSEIKGAEGVEGICRQHPKYKARGFDYDLALCKLDREVHTKFAIIHNKGPKIKDDVILIGYGCIRKDPPRGGNDGVLRVGKAPVYKLPQSDGSDWYYTRSSTTLCFGDSGGPSYKMHSDAERTFHYLMGVNSRGDIVERSLLAPVYVPKAREWMLQWVKENRVKVCGLNKKCD